MMSNVIERLTLYIDENIKRDVLTNKVGLHANGNSGRDTGTVGKRLGYIEEYKDRPFTQRASINLPHQYLTMFEIFDDCWGKVNTYDKITFIKFATGSPALTIKSYPIKTVVYASMVRDGYAEYCNPVEKLPPEAGKYYVATVNGSTRVKEYKSDSDWEQIAPNKFMNIKNNGIDGEKGISLTRVETKKAYDDGIVSFDGNTPVYDMEYITKVLKEFADADYDHEFYYTLDYVHKAQGRGEFNPSDEDDFLG